MVFFLVAELSNRPATKRSRSSIPTFGVIIAHMLGETRSRKIWHVRWVSWRFLAVLPVLDTAPCTVACSQQGWYRWTSTEILNH